MNAFVKSLETVATIVERTTESEDKTTTVVDTDARIKNLTEFRDRLRTMLASKPGSLKDLVEVNSQLAEVQTELDSAATYRKLLANETEKVAVQIAFRTRSAASKASALAPLAQAWRRILLDFTESLATLLSFIVSLLPWLAFGALVWLLLRKRIRNPFSRKAPAVPQNP